MAVAPADDLAAVWASLIGQRPVALLDWPDYANAGDHFIWLGEKALLHGRLKTEVVYEATIHDVDFPALAALPADSVFVCQGGGNFGDLYPHHQRFREAIVAGFPDRRIVMAPQSVNYRGSERFEAMRRVYATHPDLHVMARDRASFGQLDALPENVRRYLLVDAACALRPVVGELMRAFGPKGRGGALRLLRRDGERALDGPDLEGAIDWSTRDDLAELAACAPPPDGFPLASRLFTSDFDRRSWARLWAAAKTFHEASFVTVDRLHGHILASLMSKPHCVIDDAYAKISNFIATWPGQDHWLRTAARRKLDAPRRPRR